MDDAQLDRLLATRAQTTDPRVDLAVADLVLAARIEVAAVAAPRQRRRRRVAAGVALGAVVLTAGGTVTASQLNLPPFQTSEPGVQRVLEPIPVDYSTETGKAVRCQAFLEYRNLTSDQLRAAETYVADRDWSGFGQRAYEVARTSATSTAPEAVDQAFGDVLDRQLTVAAHDAVPAAGEAPRAPGPSISGWSMSCQTGQR